MEKAIKKAQQRADEKFEPSSDEDESEESSLENTQRKKVRRKLGKNSYASYKEWMEMRLREIHELHKPMDYDALRKHAKDTDEGRRVRQKKNEREIREK